MLKFISIKLDNLIVLRNKIKILSRIKKVHWTKGQKKLHETDRQIFQRKLGRNILHIRNVHPSDFGNYSCRADNELGKARTYTSLSGKIYLRLPLH